MQRTHSSRGSILLLVVGLLTMVAMLGATFLIVARMNTRQIKEASVKNLADPVAAGVVATLTETLRSHLYIGDTGPYGLAFTKPTVTAAGYFTPVYDFNSWKMFIDYPDPTIDPFLYRSTATGTPLAVPWVCKAPWAAGQAYNTGDVVPVGNGYLFCLSSHTSVAADGSPAIWSSSQAYTAGTSVYSSNVIYRALTTGNSGRDPQNNTGDWMPIWGGYFPSGTDGILVDTDGDGVADAYLVPTNVTMSNGDRYYVAVKVTDTSGLLNLNTATLSNLTGTTNAWTNPISPVNVDLRTGLGGTTGAGIGYFADCICSPNTPPMRPGMGQSLGSMTQVALSSYYSNCAQRLLNPTGGNQPLAISEETYLACYTPAAQSGHLYWRTDTNAPCVQSYNSYYLGGTMVPNAAQYALRGQLTTWSGGRYAVRRPDGDLVPRMLGINPGSGAANPGIVFDTAANFYKNQVYQQALAMLNPMIPDLLTRKYAAASFTANLWYHLDSAKSGKPSNWAFQPTNPMNGVAETFAAFAVPTSTDLAPLYLTEAYFKTDGGGAPTVPSAAGSKSFKAVELYAPVRVPPAGLYVRFGNGTPIPLGVGGLNIAGFVTGYYTLEMLSGGIKTDGTDSTGKAFVLPPTGKTIDCSSLTNPAPDFSLPIQILKSVTVNGVNTYMALDQIDPTTAGALNYGAVNSWDMAKDDVAADYRLAVAGATQITTGGTSADAVHSLGAGNAACSPAVTFLSPGIGTLDNTNTPNRPAAAPYPVLLPQNQLISGVNASTEVYSVPTINTVGDLCEVYFCGPITLNVATANGPFYSFSSMIGSNSTLTPNFISGFPIADPVRGRLNFKGYPLWNSTTTYPAGSVVAVAGGNFYVASAATAANQAPPPGGSWVAWSGSLAGWPKNVTTTTAAYVSGYYPDVPSGCLLGEFMDTLQPDPTRTDEWRHYGKINVNTAPSVFNGTPPATSNVLASLPWPTSLSNLPGVTAATIQGAAVEFVLAYRDGRKATYGTYTADYTSRATATGIPGLRGTSSFKGYLTPSEVAIPLADLATQFYIQANVYPANTSIPAKSTDFTQQSTYVALRDAMYRAISNVIAVRSDTFRANVYVELRDSSGTRTRQNWRYLTVIDRSNCRKASDRPAVVLFTEVK